MNLQEKLAKFSNDFGNLIQQGVNDSVPVDFMANQFARAEFEMRLAALQIQKTNADKETASRIIPAPANAHIRPGR